MVNQTRAHWCFVVIGLLLGFTLAVAVIELVRSESEPPDTDHFDAQTRDYLIRHPEILYDMSAILEARETEAARAADAELAGGEWDSLISDSSDGRLGNGSAAIVEFIDYNCGFCRRNHEHVAAWLEANPGRSVVIKEFPILGAGSESAARLALAVKAIYGDEGYASIHEILLAQRDTFDADMIDAIVDSAEWDGAAIREEMHSATTTAKIDANLRLAARLGITGTPGFIYPDGIGRGFQDFQALETGAAAK